jgi:hypothetical protein
MAQIKDLQAGTSGDTIPVTAGGTGQTTASLAINALVPSQTGNSGKALVTNGTSVSWGAAFVSGMIMVSIVMAILECQQTAVQISLGLAGPLL